MRIKGLIVSLILALLPLQVFANTTSSKEIIDNMVLQAEYRELVSYGENLAATITLTNVLDYRVGTAQWIMDKKPIEGYYLSDFDLYNGKTVSINLPITFEKSMPDGVLMGFDIVLDNFLKRVEFYVDFMDYDDEFYAELDRDRVFSLIKPVEIDATIKYDTYGFLDKTLKKKALEFKAGDAVLYIDQYDKSSAYIKNIDGLHYWVPYQSINISKKNYTVFTDFEKEDKEAFVNYKNYHSDTYYLIWINIERQKVNVFLGTKGNFRLIKEFTCATGANTTPTPIGEYKYTARMNIWRFPSYYVSPVFYFETTRGFAFHSRLYSYNGKLLDKTMGTPVSLGCIRMLDEDLAWIDYYIPKGTKVIVH